ncbi:hypothetical protein RCH21_003270 [Arthrobacter sp. PL16]|uniref:DUF5134 domain-containing protein n=1 Tax=Arthrobacter sp. PL16 TaxID=3071720 RepID=UPI002DF7CDE7|nr:hypothetical protein [Arthrobacter sp. PL16]
MIHLFSTPVVTWTFTAVLLLSGVYHLWHAIRSNGLTGRVNKSLHALMNVLMAAMLWNLAPSTLLAQIAVLTGATLWFVIQSVARPEFRTLCAGRQSRLKCVYHSVSMAGAALMVAIMAPVTTASSAIRPTAAAPASHVHHITTHAAPTLAPYSTAGTTISHSPSVAIMLTVFFGAAALVFIVLLLRERPIRTTTRHRAARHFVRAEHGLEALGAAIMALMFATMTT